MLDLTALFPKARHEQPIPNIAEEWLDSCAQWPVSSSGMAEAQAHSELLGALGIELDDVGETLQAEGVQLFIEAYEKLLASVQG